MSIAPPPPPTVDVSPPPATPPEPRIESESLPVSTAAVIDEVAPPPSLRRTALAALLTTLAAAIMVGGLFDSVWARPLGILAGGVGVAWTAWSFRIAAGPLLRYLFVIPVLVAAAIASGAGGTQLSPIDAVTTAIGQGGLLQTPVPFEPGWRFIDVALLAMLGAATTSLVATGRRSRLALMLPLPVVAAAALVQPPSAEMLDATVSLLLVVAGIMVLAGAEQAATEGANRGFEMRRALRGGASLMVAAVVLVVLNQSNILFPAVQHQRALPPQKPQVIPLSQVRDRELFTVKVTGSPTPVQGPWRLGTLDVYQDESFLLPPYDPSRLQAINAPIQHLAGQSMTATFTVTGLNSQLLPDVANVETIQQNGEDLLWDPRTQTFIDRNTPNSGYSFKVTAPVTPSSDQMHNAGAPQGDFSQDLQVPPAPQQVRALLAQAPENPYDRLQYVRSTFLDKVVAAGAGVPGSITADKVVAMLGGGNGTPYEIAAAQVLLARWAGVPARLGYGFYGGTPTSDGGFSIRPKDGANWLEAYFQGVGWVPLIGVPTHAQANLTNNPQTQTTAQPSEQISIQLYVPIDTSGPLQLYQVVRWWVAVASPFVAVALLMVVFFPWPLKAWRRRKRRRWADRQRNPAAVIAVEYAELRDLALDLRAGSVNLTPLEFTEHLAADDEHEELAWLVTRALWGDLQRDLQPEDAAAAREMATSLRKRLFRGQNATTRLLALASRASLREPYDARIPNTWPQGRERAASPRRLRLPRLLRLRRAAA